MGSVASEVASVTLEFILNHLTQSDAVSGDA